MHDNLARLTRCPACDGDLGVGPTGPVGSRWRPPSLRLEVAGNQPGAMDWRLSLFGVKGTWQSDNFHEARVRWVYRLCGDGHVFLDHIRMTGVVEPEWTVDEFDVMAAVGGVAAGKSYLLLRTLSQRITVSGLDHVDERDWTTTIEEYSADWLEEAPMRMLAAHYRRMEVEGLPLNPTYGRDMLPFGFLTEQIAADIVPRILAIHRHLVDEAYVDETSWGQWIRQPIVRRYQIGDRRALVAVADLPGEMFDRRSIEDDHRRALLNNYGTLVWVIDPVVTEAFHTFGPKDDTVVAASMRPDTAVNTNTSNVQQRRASVQEDLAQSLGKGGDPLAFNNGPTQHLLVCVTKADLVHLALRRGKVLRDLGEPGDVVEGVARYLIEVAKRVRARTIEVDKVAYESVLAPIADSWREPGLRKAVAEQIAGAIVDHYSGPAAFWDLVHTGRAADVKVPEGTPTGVLPPRWFSVPSLDTHIAESLTSGRSGVLRGRDLVMSALGCGVAYGLGLKTTAEALFGQQWREPRFLLCSPLAQVPSRVDTERIEPLDGTRFPGLSARSAALSQLLLCLLRRVRP